MPRARSYSTEELKERALQQFWMHGYDATSMEELVAATGISRHGIYTEFGGKHDLFLACFEHYQATVVSPAFARVERPDSTLHDVRDYFEQQIAAAEQIGLPGPGCFVANSATEMAPHDDRVRRQVLHHNKRLKHGFANALRNSAADEPAGDHDLVARLADALVVFATGLWTESRVTRDANELRGAASGFLDLLEGRLS